MVFQITNRRKVPIDINRNSCGFMATLQTGLCVTEYSFYGIIILQLMDYWNSVRNSCEYGLLTL
jgi:hypothetical protein